MTAPVAGIRWRDLWAIGRPYVGTHVRHPYSRLRERTVFDPEYTPRHRAEATS